MATIDQFIDECRSHLGEDHLFTGENPSWAWCAKFLSECAKSVGGLGFDSWAVSGVYAQLEPIADEDVERGDLVCWNYDGRDDTSWMDHIGVVTSFDQSTGWFTTIEGNSGYSGIVGEYSYDNDQYPPRTVFCRPYYDYSPGAVPVYVDGPTTLDGSKSGYLTLDDIARDVIAGRYGNGATRREGLGGAYEAVQQRVNQLL